MDVEVRHSDIEGSLEDDEPIQVLGLGDAIVPLLKRNGIRRVGQLVAYSSEELLMISGLGDLKLVRIQAALERFGCRLGDIGSFSAGRDKIRAALAEEERTAENKRHEEERLVWPLVTSGFSIDQIVELTRLPKATVMEARNAWMVEERIGGATLQQIAGTAGLTRERVRQVIERAGVPRAKEVRSQRRDQRQLEEALQAERLRGLIRDAAMSRPGSSVTEIAREVGVTEPEVRRNLTRMGTKLVCGISPSGVQRAWSNEQLLDVLRIVSTKSTPVTVASYNRLLADKEFEGPTSQVFYSRFGSWLAACEEAGVQSGERRRDNYVRGWSNVELGALVVEFLFSIEHDGSLADFRRCLGERPDAPSEATVRKRLGGWDDMKRNAIERIVSDGRLTELLDVCE